MPNRHLLQNSGADDNHKIGNGGNTEILKSEKHRSEPSISKMYFNHTKEEAHVASNNTPSHLDRMEAKAKDALKSGSSAHKKRPVRRSHTMGSVEDALTSLAGDVKDGSKARVAKKELARSSCRPTVEHVSNSKKTSVTSLEGIGSDKDTFNEELDTDRSPRPSISYGHRASKVNFQSVSSRVTRLLKAKKMFLPRKSLTKEDGDDVSEEKLPKTPRFSSSLSAEAQYALLKGYEDRIADTLTKKYPEFNDIIKRNKTPHHNIILANKNLNNSNKKPRQWFQKATVDADDREEMLFTSENLVKEKIIVNSRVSNSNESRKTTNEIEQAHPKQSAASCLENLRRLSLVFPALATSKSERDENILSSSGLAGRAISRSVSSVPSVVPRERQILLSYRLERAMDLVDAMKPTWENTLSPRISKRQEAPVVDYNHWADQWATEFETAIVN